MPKASSLRQRLADQSRDLPVIVHHHRERVGRMPAAGAEIERRQHDATVALRRRAGEPVGGQRIKADRQMLAVPFERSERQVGDRPRGDPLAQLIGEQ